MLNNKTFKILLFSLVFFIILFQTFWNLDSFKLEYWDEGTNAIVVNSLEENGEPLNMEILDNEIFFEKPPLWYYLTYFSTELFGFNLFSLRLISALSGIILSLLIFFEVRKRFGFYSGLISILSILATRHLFFSNLGIFSTHNFRSADLDILQILFILVSFMFLWKEETTKNLVISGIFSGLAFMTKGPFGLLPIIIYFISNLKSKTLLINLLKLSLPAVMIILPWHIAMFIEHGNLFIEKYFEYHILSRSTTAIEGHQQPLTFYFDILLNPNIFFGGFLLFVALINNLKENLKSRFTKYSWFVVISVILIITIIPTKLAWYLLYIYPFAAILIGKLFRDIDQSKKYKIFGIFLIGFGVMGLSKFGINEPLLIAGILISSVCFLITKDLRKQIFLTISFTILLNLFTVINLQEATIENILKNNTELTYIYDENLNRSDWYYLKKEGVNWLKFEDIESFEGKYITQDLWIFKQSSLDYKLHDKGNNYFIIEISKMR